MSLHYFRPARLIATHLLLLAWGVANSTGAIYGDWVV
jgi:hypothetical protein